MPPGYTPKLLLVTKLTTVLLFAAFMQVSAGTYAQKISIKATDVKITEIFKKITKQTGYYFIYNKDLIDKAPVVSIKVANAGILETLDKLFSGFNLSYEITDMGIAVTEKKSSGSSPDKQRNVFDNIDVHGRVIDENGKGLPGAVIKLKESRRTTVTNADGEFTFLGVDKDATIIISFLGFKVQEIKVSKQLGNIQLEPVAGQLNEVGVVSTGYQTIPKERATGSFVLIDSVLFNRKVGTNILDRLDGVTSSLIFNKNKIGNTPDISIRGRSTISSNANPLIVLDNFPYDGDISNINPQDVKSITILKDGAAASIWGSRAGNGVIVITTHRGNFNQKPRITFNSNITIGKKPDLYYQPQLTNTQFIEVEKFLFDKGFYNSTINNGYGSLSPAVEILLANRKGQISAQKKDEKLDSISKHDNRNDLEKYYYRHPVNQQYQMNINGGGNTNKYYVSLGYDKNLGNTVINKNDRITLSANNTISLLGDKLELLTGLNFTTNTTNFKSATYSPLYPYEKIADESGNPIAITNGTLRLNYVDTVGKGKLLDWHYRPLEEMRNSYSSSKTQTTDYRVNIGLNYKLLEDLKISLNYVFNKGITESNNNNTLDSYSTRNLINTYTQIIPATGIITYPVPVGDVLNSNNSLYYSHYARSQINYDKVLNQKNIISAIGGFEVKDYQSSFRALTLYGYNEETQGNGNLLINPLLLYPFYYGTSSAKIPTSINNGGTVDRYRSYYLNASYSYDRRYTLSMSARKDESNLFGVKTNQKGVPLWSAGLAWTLSNEDFYKSENLPYLKLRTTYGYNGNVNKSVSAYLTATTNGARNLWNEQFYSIQNPPNPSLEWEKVKNINFGVDFQSKKNVISGSAEFWVKDGINLIGTSPIAPQTGLSIYTGNSANMRGKGVDIILYTKNITRKFFQWNSNLLFNYTADKITSYKLKATTNSNIIGQNFLQPLEGYSYYSLFSYKWRGLDNQGNPQSVLNGETSKDYSRIANSNNREDLVYSGTRSPKYFGNLINTLTWKSLELSFNISYKAGYVYRRSSLDNTIYSSPKGTSIFHMPDYELRWQKPGDELTTNVPSLLYPVNAQRNTIYFNSEVLIEKADHIRLQDIKLSYSISKEKAKRLPFSNVNVYSYAANLGVLWKASKYKIDPDFPNGIPISKTLAIGVKADF